MNVGVCTQYVWAYNWYLGMCTCYSVIWGVFGIRVLNWELWGHVNVIWDHVIDAVGVYIPTGNISKKVKISLS